MELPRRIEIVLLETSMQVRAMGWKHFCECAPCVGRTCRLVMVGAQVAVTHCFTAAAARIAQPPSAHPNVHDTLLTAVACYLLLVEQEGSEIHFRIKRSTKMSKLMDAYCKQRVCVYCADASATHRPHHSATPLGHTRQRAKHYHAINN